jgi:hypothetical protein
MVALGAQGKALRAIAEAMQTIRSVMRGSQAS